MSFAKKLELDQNEIEMIEHSVKEMETERGLDANAALADMRYSFIENVCDKAVVKCKESREHMRSVKIDNVLTNKYLALPLFLLIMVLIFWLTFGVIGNSLSNLLTLGIDKLTGITDSALTHYGINPVVHSLIINGIFAGLGSVLSFLPIIVVLFFFLSILEDTGYMARVAFVMDKLLRKIGLSGRSFVPKIPIYAVFSAAFFPDYSVLVMSCLYIFGIITGIIAALILNKTAFKGNPVPFVMELPNYRLPSAKSVLLLMWDKAKDFLQKAFTVIFIAAVLIWFFGAFDMRLNFVNNSANSILAGIGRAISPIFKPLGLEDWRISTSLLAGLSAKEAVVSTMSVLLGTGADGLSAALSNLFTPLTAVSFLTFTLLYTPCVAAIATLKAELNSRLQTAGVIILQCSVAWVCAFIVYSLGALFI